MQQETFSSGKIWKEVSYRYIWFSLSFVDTLNILITFSQIKIKAKSLVTIVVTVHNITIELD